MESSAQYFACLCRTCMNKVEASSFDDSTVSQQQWPSIFDTIEECGDLRIAELLSDAVPQIVVQLSDELPKKICTECLERLLSVYRFQEMCVQSDKEMHKLLSKEQTVLKTPMLGEAITGETETIDADLQSLNELRCSSTPQNLQQPSTREPLAEVTVQTIEPEAAESRADDNLQNNDELPEECMDEFEEFIKNEPNEVDKANTYKGTMHSTNSVTKDTTKELEDDQEVNVTSSRHNCHLCNKSYKRCEYLRKHLNDHKKKANNRKEYCYACHLCNESYKKQQYLSRHLSLEHPNRSSHTQKSNVAKQPATHAEDKPYQCPLCPLRFSSPSHMASHKTTSRERIKPHQCDICGRKFRLQRILIKHKRKHSKEKAHKCDLCEKRFAHKRQLTVHKRQHTGKKPYKCKYCKLAFITIGARTNHLRRHLGKNIHRCMFCPLAFPSAVKLSYHLTTHNNEDPVTRERNLKALHEEVAKLESKLLKESAEPQSEEEQQQHQNLSNKEIGQLSTEPDDFREFIKNDPNETDKSNTKYSVGDTMHSTISVTRDEATPIEPEDQQANVTQDDCSVFVMNEPIEDDDNSNTEYSDADTIQSTISVTKNEPTEQRNEKVKATSSRHNCHLCNKSYKRREYLTKHLNDHKKKANNRKEYCYACHLCNESYKKQQYLSRHLSLEHPNRTSHTQKSNVAKQPATHAEDKPYQCPLCPLRFSSPSHMASHKTTSHERIKPHQCDICGRKFRLQRILIKHKRKHSKEKPHRCDLCEKRFAQKRQLTVHKRQHTGKKPYKCKYCKLAFITIGARTNHLRRHLGKNIHRCMFCPLAFPSAVKLSYHLTTHNNEDPVTRERNLKALHEEVAKLESKLLKESAEPQSEEEQQQHQNLPNKEIGQLSTEPDDFREFINNDPNETDKSNTKYSVGDTMHSTISLTRDEATPIEPEDQQANVTQDDCSVFVIEDDDNSNTEYSDADTIQSTISVTKNEPTEQRNEKVKATSSRHNCHLCNKSYKRREYLTKHLNDHKKKANNRKEYCYACHLCNESYKKQQYLSRHLSLEHPNRTSHTQKSNLAKQPATHAEDKSYQCPLCPLRFSSPSHMASHKTTSHERIKPHQCDICGRKFRLQRILIKHKRKHSKEKPHRCDLCEKRFAQKRQLTVHKRQHTGKKPYKCKYCKLAFITIGARTNHLRRHLGKNIHRCMFCPLAFPSAVKLSYHLTTHNNEDPVTRERNLKALHEEVAKLESKLLKESAELQSEEEQQQHQNLSNKEIGQLSTEPDDFREFINNDPNETDKSNTKYSVGDTMHSTISLTRDEATPIEPEDQQANVTQDDCSVFVMNEPIEDDDNSNTEYSDADTIQSTISVTKNEPTEQRNEKVKATSARHKCHLCNKSFKNDKYLRTHLNAHKIKADNQKEYCYSCHLCSQSYKKEWILARHVKIEHSIVLQRTTCNFCNKKLTTPSVLRQHIRIHTGERPYSCTECGQSFAMKNSLTQHRNNHHSSDKPHKCPYCPRGYNAKSALKRHSIIHEEVKGHQCDICLKRFGLKCDLATHNKLYHSKEKPHKCEFCGKRFIFIRELQTHNRNHTGEKPYKCKYCERGFASRSLLSQHLRSHLGKNIYRCELCPLAFPLHPELRLHLASHKNEDPEKRERNLKALQEKEAKLKLKLSKERAKRKSKEKQQQPKLSQNKLTRIVERKRRTNALKSYNCYFD